MFNAFMLLPLVYYALVLVAAVVVLVVLWRIMRAQETTARALEQLAVALSRPAGPQG